jgi:putative tricarboxylic transport membrane protein
MDYFSGILSGFQVAFEPTNFFYCFVGVFLGTLIGVLPGIGPSGTICILLPLTFKISPVTSIILLSGIYYGAMYGGSTTAILVNVPGEAASVISCLDGYKMARQGRAGPALGVAAFGSFIAGTFSVIALMFLSYPLSKFALAFGPPEYTALILLGITLILYLAQKSMVKALISALFGFILSFVGIDMMTGGTRYVFGSSYLIDGLNIIPVVMGLFGVAEVLRNVYISEKLSILETKLKNLLPTRQDWRDSYKAISRGSLIGFVIGIIPGGSAVLATFVSYAIEKRLSKHPQKFGHGAIEGLAGPESANNAAFGGGLVPLFALGIPPTVVQALLFAAMMIQGIQPGPFLIIEHPEVFWGLVASMYLGNIMLLIINLPLIGLWVQLLKVPQWLLLPFILVFCFIGVYSINNSLFDVGIMILFGILGYLMTEFEFELAPLVLAFVLGPIFEKSLRQSLTLSQGGFGIFFTRPLSLGLLIMAGIVILSYFLFKRKDEAVTSEGQMGG